MPVSAPTSIRRVSPYDENVIEILVIAVKAQALARRINFIIEDLGKLPLMIADGPDGAHIGVNAVLRLEEIRNELMALEPAK